MSKSESQTKSEKEIVAVTKHGQATIPKRFREKLGIDAPGKVLFREGEDGTITVERVRSPSEMRGFAAQSEATTDKPATELLREKRAEDRADRDELTESE
ncbi:MAG: looped-hinge helix DNA binding domain, AbrB family [Halonotius sp. J07HN4]|jgi:looped-hinge helix DNA binding domain, AbrB family|nr:MAG: looped-hinge helix DNA binding domain, AbrB family [Halonotius sp. J07HN4]